MSQYRYPPTALVGDYSRSGGGLLLSAGPLLFADPSTIMRYVLAGLAGLFLIYGLRTVLRQTWRIELTDEGMTTGGPFGRTLLWDDITSLQLRYYSTRRDRQGGWMELRLRGAKGNVRVESDLEGFNALVARAAREVQGRGVTLSDTTRANLDGLGLQAPSRREAPGTTP